MPEQHTKITLTINRPIEEVFAYITIPENNVYWVSGATEVTKLSEGGGQVGTTYSLMQVRPARSPLLFATALSR